MDKYRAIPQGYMTVGELAKKHYAWRERYFRRRGDTDL